MRVLNAMDLKKGKKAEFNSTASLTQPLQFVSAKDKDIEWSAWNMDWLEWQGLKQLRRNSRRLLKNYKLANGIIDKTDYILNEDNDYSDVIQQLASSEDSALELKFYPIIPNVINTLCNEFSKRTTKLNYRSVDEISYNEMLEKKRAMIEENLLGQAQMKIQMKLQEQGVDMGDPEVQKQAQEQVKSLPEVEQFFKKDYKSIVEEWAQHQYEADTERFHMEELEERAFRDSLVTDREFWHFKMYEDDYDIELWNPVLTFYHKSPDVRYISEGNFVGKIDMLSVSDIIDKYGWIMTEEQLETLERIYPVRAVNYAIAGNQNDGTFYDATKSHEWNTSMPSLGYRQFMATRDMGVNPQGVGSDIVSWILGESEDFLDFGQDNMLRVTTAYWKSQRKLGYLTKIAEDGRPEQSIIGEEYKITDNPIYNTNLIQNKGPENLVFGEHIEWIWINEVHGGVKIGLNQSTFWGMNNAGGVDPMYLGINQNKIGRLKFQFKGDKTLYGCKLPVEGRIFTDRNSRSVAPVDLMKPFQIAYNIVNNQIADILVDELGTVVAFDQNGLPRHSMGEDWGKHNLAKAYTVMKDFQMMPLDTTIANTENPLSMQHFQVLNLEQTNRLMSRVQLANYFKSEAFANIGVTQERMGQQIEQDTAEGVRAALNGSYAMTEQYFIQHSDNLMPRVHQMRTDLAQHYHATNPSVTLQYLTSQHEKINFQMNGTDLLLRDIHVYATTNANHRAVLEKLRNLALNNNTAGASIYDLGSMIKADSLPEITDIMKTAEQKQQAQQQQNQQHEQQMQDQAIKAAQQEKQATWDYDSQEAEKDRRKDILVAEIKASGFGAMMDIDKNEQSDFKDAMDEIKTTEQYQEQVGLQREKESNRTNQQREKNNLDREKIQVAREKSQNDLNIARENKNQYDKPKEAPKKKK